MAQIRIGISGWTYPPWRKKFYPADLPQARELEYASRQVNSIEINGTFYSLQKPQSFADWYERTPADFVFSVKGGRFLTHVRRLKDIDVPLANFFASGVLRLNEKLGPFLWQLPPNFVFDAERIESFLALLPHSASDALKLARKHDERMKTRVWLETDKDRPVRHTVEVRHESFRNEAFIKLLRKYDVALTVADTARRYPLMEDLTADFVYVRLHGDEELYASGYTEDALEEWAKRIRAWMGGTQIGEPSLAAPELAPPKCASRDVYVYFDNDVKVRSPFDAMSLARRFGIEPAQEQAPPEGESTEKPRSSWPAVKGSAKGERAEKGRTAAKAKEKTTAKGKPAAKGPLRPKTGRRLKPTT